MIGPKESRGKNASINNNNQDFLGDSVIKNLPANVETRVDPCLGRSHMPPSN